MFKILRLSLILFFISLKLLSQTQIGSDIDGNTDNDQFGASTSISYDGTIIAVGTGVVVENKGYVKVYKNINGFWQQLGNDILGENKGTSFGRAISLSSNGNILAVGASGFVKIYKNENNNWIQIGSDINGEEDGLGFSISLSADGSIVAIGAIYSDNNGNNSGSVRIFKNENNNWIQIGSDINGEAIRDFFGFSVSLSADGNVVAIGARFNDNNGSNSGSVRIFKNENSDWIQVGSSINGTSLADGTLLGTSVSLSSDGSIVATGAIGNNGTIPGFVKVFKNINNQWYQLGSDINGEAIKDYFGGSISLSSNGDILAIGAVGNDKNGNASGHVRIYKFTSNEWIKIGTDIEGEAANDNSGYSVSLSAMGNIVAIGARLNDGNGSDSGHLRVYDLSSVLSTKNFLVENLFKIYPNPANNLISVHLNKSKLNKVNIYNNLGQLIKSSKVSELDISNILSGIYFVEVQTKSGKEIKKLIIN